MQERPEQLQDLEALSIAGGLIVAILVFALTYHLLGWLLHDKPLSFVVALFTSLFCLFNFKRYALNHLKERK